MSGDPFVAQDIKKMSANDYFELGENVGRLKNVIGSRFKKMEEDFILWGTDIDSLERRKLQEAMRLIFEIKCGAKEEKKDILKLTEMFCKATLLWEETVTTAEQC